MVPEELIPAAIRVSSFGGGGATINARQQWNTSQILKFFKKHTINIQIHNMNQNIVFSVGSDQGNIKNVQCVISGHGEGVHKYMYIGTVYISNFMEFTEECQELAGWVRGGGGSGIFLNYFYSTLCQT